MAACEALLLCLRDEENDSVSRICVTAESKAALMLKEDWWSLFGTE
jgi:hypothetical protein